MRTTVAPALCSFVASDAAERVATERWYVTASSVEDGCDARGRRPTLWRVASPAIDGPRANDAGAVSLVGHVYAAAAALLPGVVPADDTLVVEGVTPDEPPPPHDASETAATKAA